MDTLDSLWLFLSGFFLGGFFMSVVYRRKVRRLLGLINASLRLREQRNSEHRRIH